MISWMQKNNKYLVWTIWIATIAFIGAGFVGWGQYQMGSKATSAGKVGEVEIERSHLNTTYKNIYAQYSQMFKGKLDKETEKKLNISSQAYNRLATQAKILNLAKEYGIAVSDEELRKVFTTIEAFQYEGKFNQEQYNAYLSNQGTSTQTFESMLKNELITSKVLSLINTPSLSLEKEILANVNNISNKINYKVITLSDVNQTVDETEVKTYWEQNKNNFLTKKQYKLTTLWTSTDVNVTEEELKNHYELNSFSFTDKTGKHLKFAEVKNRVKKEVQIKNARRAAMLDFKSLKKSEANNTETVELEAFDSRLPKEIWDELLEKSSGTLLKPKVVDDKYLSIKIDSVTEPTPLSYDKAKEKVMVEYKNQMQKENLQKLGNDSLKKVDTLKMTTSDYLKIDTKTPINGLNEKESLHFLQKLFTSLEENGMITLSDKIVVYTVLEQKVDKNSENDNNDATSGVKQKEFENNLLRKLSERFTTKTY